MTDPRSEPAGEKDSAFLAQFAAFARRTHLERWVSLILLALALAGCVTTFLAMTGRLPVTPDAVEIQLLLTADLVLVLLLTAMIGRRLIVLWLQRRRDVAGARLHARLMTLFALVAVTPTLIVAVFTALLFVGMQDWFSERVRTAVRESLAVAQSYLEEHRRTIVGDALAMAQDLNRAGPSMLVNPQRFSQFVSTQAAWRSLTEALVFDSSGHVLARAGFSLLLEFEPDIPPWAIEQANQGEVAILEPESDDRVRAIIKLEAFPDTYLFVGRLIDPRVLAHTQRSSDAVKLYEQIENQRESILATFAAIFAVISLLLLLVAAWIGLAFANRLGRPIAQLIEAAQRVGAGDLTVRVADDDEGIEIDALARAFNRMTGDLQRQRGELIEANQQIEARRRFGEAVLSGVTAGVLGLDRDGYVTIANRRAHELLALQPGQLMGRRVSKLSREMRELLEQARRKPRRIHERQAGLAGADGSSRTLLVRIVAEQAGEKIIGYVVTFDDITELLSAQRKAAWADVARRIAHEIKNPLTPIQLSAERLKRRYLKQISEDPETFAACTDTIVRQVGDIGRMVDEFSNFARMPTPAKAPCDLIRLVIDSLALQRSAHGAIRFLSELPDKPVPVQVDAAQIRQALTNLLQNAVDSIEGRQAAEGGGEGAPAGVAGEEGLVRVRLSTTASLAEIAIEDNGRGLPKKDRDRLTEPYVTTREKGTGLGLAIVKKILEDHGGSLALADREGGGAVIRLTLPLGETASRDGPAQEGRIAVHGS
ncbi:two-component system, NtrC family, nitrogen regulation sensor histidine kinase NtrY [Tistlia consotensis]|uniref:Nitrogen regulation protein n=1 Tax=Tistlia consotensis USBA 355 TaxID=560819 RepID=A0A1Y6BX75_9PROT|nr:PAS domain-containing sensor histidine kinase [Tistlia consotensis]SMF25381.1 two-component system, NtrC family, nitrogen regulation sensor histidine kinase NtrY [Tistlia consotensis USBA 355]SNR59427.1 two-component system, NtrC family, nitrogen regulation sensor histidine kinase NtrY [Tistlia consotensis]